AAGAADEGVDGLVIGGVAEAPGGEVGHQVAELADDVVEVVCDLGGDALDALGRSAAEQEDGGRQHLDGAVVEALGDAGQLTFVDVADGIEGTVRTDAPGGRGRDG